MAVGAYAGRADLLDLVAPAGKVYQAGTLSANPLAMRTGLATVKKIKQQNIYPTLEKRTEFFTHELRGILSKIGLSVTALASVFWIHPESKIPIRSLNQLPKDLANNYKNVFHMLLKHGVYLAPSGYEVGFVSWAHDEKILPSALEAFYGAVSELD